MIIQRLRILQHDSGGVLPDAELAKLARELAVPLHRLQELASYFPAFRQEYNPPAKLEVRVCRDMSCHHRGAAGLIAAGEKVAAKLDDVRVEGVSCLGRCDRAPVAWVERQPMHDDEQAWVYALDSAENFCDLIRTLAPGTERPEPDSDLGYKTAINSGWTIDPYPAGAAKYAAVRKLAEQLDQLNKADMPLRPPEGQTGAALEDYVQKTNPSLWQVKLSGLGGMGGAGAPAYTKRMDVWQQKGDEKYVVANGDESEPGTFKDRELLLRHPHLIVEGVILTGLMIGATKGYIFIRHEYHEQIHACKEAIKEAVKLGACGRGIFDADLDFSVEVYESPGGYILGEQSALLEAMEDRRGQPRNRPPEITSNGLYDKPTVLNNVETLAWLPSIVLNGGETYAKGAWKTMAPAGFSGKLPRFNGRRLFSVSGDVIRPGVFEVPIGMPLGELLQSEAFCGGLRGNLKAIATSGPSGGFLPARLPLGDFPAKFAKYLERKKRGTPPADTSLAEWFVASYLPLNPTAFDLLNAPLDLGFFGIMAELFGLPIPPLLGAGIVVYAEGTDTLTTALNFTEFFRNESCGKCVPCRLGSQKLVNIGADLVSKRSDGTLRAELPVIRADVTALQNALTQTSICSLGTSAPTPLASSLAYFPEDLAARATPDPR